MVVYAQNSLDSACNWPRRGNLSYQDGFATWTLEGGQAQQSCLFETPPFRATGGQFYARALWRFPVGYTHNGPPSFPGREHKLFCISVEAASGKGRVLVNAQGQKGTLRAYVEGYDGAPGGPLLLDTDAPIPLDGLWHMVEVLIGRELTGMGTARLWLDGKLVGEGAGTTGTSPFTTLQVGAFVNQGSDVRKSFQLRELFCADARPEAAQQPVPSKPPATPSAELLSIANALEGLGSDFAANMAVLARRLRGLKP